MPDSLYWALRLSFTLSRYVPLRWRYRLGMLAGEAAYWCWPAKRHATRRTMAVVVGDTENGRRAAAAARLSLRNYGRYVVDFLNLPNVDPAAIIAQTDAAGWEHLDSALAAGKGAIFVTGHFGLWDYAPCLLAARYPGRMSVVAETFTSPKVDALVQGQRVLQGSTVIPMTNVRAMVRTLRGNGILALLVDRPVHGAGDEGVEIEFFGRRTLVPAGAATLAALTGATILPGYFLHRDKGGYEGRILPPIEPPDTGNRARDIQTMTQQVFDALEQIIRRSPGYWYMFREMWPPAGQACAAREEAGAAV